MSFIDILKSYIGSTDLKQPGDGHSSIELVVSLFGRWGDRAGRVWEVRVGLSYGIAKEVDKDFHHTGHVDGFIHHWFSLALLLLGSHSSLKDSQILSLDYFVLFPHRFSLDSRQFRLSTIFFKVQGFFTHNHGFV